MPGEASQDGKLFIRAARLPEEQGVFEDFVKGLTHYEAGFVWDRRTDDAVGRDYYASLAKRIAKDDGRVFVAEIDGKPVGWLVSLISEAGPDVRPEERQRGFIVELFIEPAWRSKGVGRALAQAAEADFRARGIHIMMIGVMSGNAHARAAYEAWGFAPYVEQLMKRL